VSVDKLYKVDEECHVTEHVSAADENYQMRDAGGEPNDVINSCYLATDLQHGHCCFL